MRSISVSEHHLPRITAQNQSHGSLIAQPRQRRALIERNMKCKNHAFCNHGYEVCELDALVRAKAACASGPGAPIADPFELMPKVAQQNHDSETVSPKRLRNSYQQEVTHAQHHRQHSQSLGPGYETVGNHENSNKSTAQHAQRNSMLSPQQEFSLKHITEEALDDWIAQSANRPIVSFLDPYKKFNAPKTLIEQIKRRWGRYYKQDEIDQEYKKMLLFDLENEDPEAFSHLHSGTASGVSLNTQQRGRRRPGYLRPTRQPRERQKELSFHYSKLEPRLKPGQPITLREEQKYENVREQHSVIH